jgi:transposase-like protein
MTEQSTTKASGSSSLWERLEEFARDHVQRFIQALLEEEVTELLGREKSVRRAAVDAPRGYRNGYGKARRLKPWRCTIADGHLGIWAALAEQQPTAAEQRCWNHRMDPQRARRHAQEAPRRGHNRADSHAVC